MNTQFLTMRDICRLALSGSVAGCDKQVGGGDVGQRAGQPCSGAQLDLWRDTVVVHGVHGG